MTVIGTTSGKIGLRPGIGLREILSESTFTIDCHVTKNDNTSTFTIDSRVSTYGTTSSFTADSHILKGTYTSTFTIDSVLAYLALFTADCILVTTNTNTFTIDSRLSTDGSTSSFTIDSTLANLGSKTFTIDSYLQKLYTSTFTIDSYAATQKTSTFTSDSRIATTRTSTFTADGYIASYGSTSDFTADCTLASFKAQDFTIDSIIVKTPYYSLGGIDITDHIEQPDIDGLESKLSDYSPHSDVKSTLYRQGSTPLSFTFNVWWFALAEYDTFLETVNSIAEDLEFYHGKSDWFYRVKSISVRPSNIDHGRNVYVARVSLVLEDPYIYSISYNDLVINSIALPYTSTDTFLNYGNVDSPFYSVSLAGKYVGGYHTRDLVFSIMNGATVESYIPISDRLLSDETATLDIDGKLTCVYTDDFADSTRFTPDCYASLNTTVSGGLLSIGSGGYCTYKLYGPHPTKQNVKLTANITTTGSPYIQVSSDNSTWYTAVPAASVTSSSEVEYNLDYSNKLADVYVRFYCPTGSTMSMSALEFEAVRDTSYYDLPQIGSGDTRTIKISDGSTSSHYAGLVNISYKARKWST